MSAMPRLSIAGDQPVTDYLPDDAPRTLASAFERQKFARGAHFRGEFYAREGPVYRKTVREVLRADLAAFLAEQWIRSGDDGPKQYKPNQRKINDALDALATITQVRCEKMPAWLDDPALRPDPGNVIAFMNGLLDVREYVAGKVRLLPPTAAWFSVNVLPFDFDEDAPESDRWWEFLAGVWDEDVQSIELLQEETGYFLTSDTSLQKIFLHVGPMRSGKGTIARVVTKLVGPNNIAAPTLAGLAMNFGLWPLIGKQLAIIADARLSNRADQATVVERLLSISGEDSLTIDRKNQEPLTIRLPTRLLLLSNELPKLGDASGALAERFMVLTMRKSFLGKEDTRLTDKLTSAAELPGILAWALKGLRRLQDRGHFVMPQSSQQSLDELRDLVSPIRAFIGERCMVAPGKLIESSQLFRAWGEWCKEQGRDHAGTVQTFGRDLRAALPAIGIVQPRQDGSRVRCYEGIDLVPTPWLAS